ncbi:pseudouridine synthase family protein [Shewanella youngdeokensis]|uniref:RNA pseudouridine synthase n=1 Tax=Shewanella youngdeokensis TaxID=2999068 RepID=A0ABZ0JWH9_9GAMM|nr:RNA pseudouridine synthase [Shewanella sp. DAU334]
MPLQKNECHIKVTSADTDAVSLLSQQTGLTKQAIKQAMQKGAVWLTHGKQTNRLRRGKKALSPGDELHLYYNTAVLNEQVAEAELLFDEGQYSIWYKPFGMRCQGSKWSDHTTINRFAETHLTPARSAYIVHRLDLAATGLIVIGHSKKVTAAIAKLFETRALDKYYQVIVEGQFSPSKLTINTDVDGKAALSHAHLLQYNAALNQSKVQVKIESGRKHQIRVHMASVGHPVVGDRLHGNGSETTPNLQLTSCYLNFVCPVTQQNKVFELPEAYRPQFQL